MPGLSTWMASSCLCLATTQALAQDVPVEKYQLGNGMTVILREDHTVPLATVNIWYRVGSKDEPPRHSGFAHLFEHLMFMGTRRVSTGEFDKIMEGGGGDNNASTAEDRTNYFDVGPSNLLPTLLWLEADRLEELGHVMTLKKLNLQRDVVKNERRQNTENTPYGSAYEAINGLMFPVGHPYHTSVIGSMADLDNASVPDVQGFFGRFYVPSNASMVVAGDFDRSHVKHQIARLFGSLPKSGPIVRKPVPPLPRLGVKRVTLSDKVQFPKILMIWHSPPAYKPGDAEMQLAGSVLADGINSRLYQRLIVKDKLATSVSANQEQRLLGSLFTVDLTAARGADLKKLQAAADEELAMLRSEGPTRTELRRQSAKIESGTLQGLQEINNVADTLNNFEFYLGKPNSFREVLSAFRKATPQEVRRVAARTLDPANRVIITVLPKKEAALPPPSSGAAPMRFQASPTKKQDPRSVRPPVGKPKAFVAPLPSVFALDNGMPVYYWRRSTLPLMSVDLQLKTGADADPAAKAGLSSLTADLLTQGAGTRDAKSYQSALDLLGASVDASAGHHRISATLNVLARSFKSAVSLYADAVERPHLAVKDFERIKRVTVAALETARDEVAVTASLVASREYFGKDHPMGRSAAGTPATVGTLDLSDVKQEYGRQYSSSNGVFYAAGSLPVSVVRDALNESFGGWRSPPAKPQAPAPPVNRSAPGLRVFVVDKPGAVQTAIRFLMPAPSYSDPNRLKLVALGTLLGGSFTSRLNQNLREDKGFTYGASASFSLDQKFGDLSAAASVRADVTGASIKEFVKEFDRIRSGDITNAEVAKATATLRTEEVSSVSTLQGLVQQAAGLAVFGRPITGLTEDQKSLTSLTAAQLNSLSKRAIPYEQGVLVLVGDKDTILKQMQGLGLPEPHMVSGD